MTDAKALRIAAKLYDIRDAMKAVLGDRFQEEIQDYQEHLTKLSLHRGASILEAALVSAEFLQKGGHGNAVPLLLAAAAELIEPSTSTSPAGAIRTHETRPPSAPEGRGAEHRGLRGSPTTAPGPGAPAPGRHEVRP